MAVKVHSMILCSGTCEGCVNHIDGPVCCRIYEEIISDELRKEFEEALSNEGNEENRVQN